MMDVLSSWMVIVYLMRGGHSRFDPTKVYRVELIVILLDPLVLSSSERTRCLFTTRFSCLRFSVSSNVALPMHGRREARRL
jgi:hypothetical protein